VIGAAAHPSSTKTMIVEPPSSACTAKAFRRPAMTRTRHAFEQASGVPSR
jgi:hypothetical protein